MKKILIALGAVGGYLIAGTAHAQAAIATSSIGGLVDNVISDGGSVLSTNLPKVFGFAIALAIFILVFFWIRGMVRRPR